LLTNKLLLALEHLFSINSEGGPLLCVDATAAANWNTDPSGSDYYNLCASFEASPGSEAVLITIAARAAIAWEMAGAGTADVFRDIDGTMRIIRAWVNDDSSEEIERLANARSPNQTRIGEIDIPSGRLAVLWAPETGKSISAYTDAIAQEVKGTSMDGTYYILKVACGKYSCVHDEVKLGESEVRRLTLTLL